MKSSSRILEKIATSLVPSLQIPKRTWISPWKEKERKEFTSSSRLIFIAWAICWVLHFFLIDIPQKKEPLSWWAFYRFSLASAAAIGLAITFFNFNNNWRLFRLPLAGLGIAAVYLQGMSMQMRPQVPFFYVPLLAFLFALALRTNPLITLLYFGINLAVSAEWFTLRPTETHHMVSSSVLGAILLFYLRGRQNIEISNFVLEQQKLEAHKNLIEMQTQFTDQLKMFLPRKIYSDVENKINIQGMSPLQAADEVLRPRTSHCVILYSDIRGYTRMSRMGVKPLEESVMRAQKITTDCIERNNGIPRLQGDLVYSYFESNDKNENIRNAVKASVEIYEKMSALNSTLTDQNKIVRYMIIASGEVLVGNLGGTEGSRDISVLGDAANLPSRIDLLTKDLKVGQFLKNSPIILSESAYRDLEESGSKPHVQVLSLKDLNIEIKDFPFETKIVLMSPSQNSNLINSDIDNTVIPLRKVA